MKITKDIVKYWTEEQFQKYRLISWNSTHQQKLKKETLPEWYMFSKETLIQELEEKKISTNMCFFIFSFLNLLVQLIRITYF